MKNLTRTFRRLALTIFSALTVAACDPCSGVVCTNGTCSNGTCVCEPGYERNNTSCVAVNMSYIGTGSVVATVVAVDANGNSTTTNNVGYTLTASSSSPYMFTLVSFANLIKNDIAFEISDTNYDVLKSGTVTTAAGNAYTYTGAKVGSQIQLVITDTATQTKYTVSYTV